MQNFHRSERYDVVIVGGRVAGASTGLLLARAGHRVAVVDRVTMPADTLSTHILFPAANVQLRRWGLLETVAASGAPATSTLVSNVDGVAFELPFPDPASGLSSLHHPRRTVLDPILRSAAGDAGAELVDGLAVDGLLRDGAGRVVGVAGRDAAGERVELHAHLVVGADGWRSRVARMVAAEAYDQVGVVNATHYAYWADLDDRGLEVWNSTVGLMAGVVPTNGGACVYVNCRPDHLRELRGDTAQGYLRLLSWVAPDLAERLTGARRTTPVRGTTGLPNFKRVPWGPGWLLVGDAGCTKDPVSGHGISDAMVSAELAALAVHRVLHGADEDDALGGFHERRDHLVSDIYDVALEWASYDWTAEELLDIQSRYGQALTAEAQAVAALPSWEAVRMPRTGRCATFPTTSDGLTTTSRYPHTASA